METTTLPTERTVPFQRVVVTLDGSELAERALVEAEYIAREANIPMHLVRVVDITRFEKMGYYGLAVNYTGITELFEQEQQFALDYLDEMRAKLEERGLTVTTEMRQGLPDAEIDAAVRPGDLLVIATHGRTGIRRWFMGSVAEQVVRNSTVPVLLVRALQVPNAEQANGGDSAVVPEKELVAERV